LRWHLAHSTVNGGPNRRHHGPAGDGAIGWNDSLARRERDGSIDGGSGGELDPNW